MAPERRWPSQCSHPVQFEALVHLAENLLEEFADIPRTTVLRTVLEHASEYAHLGCPMLRSTVRAQLASLDTTLEDSRRHVSEG
jgi:hypothetical protein